MNTREKEFAEFVYECVSGHKPRNDAERSGVLELRHRLKAYAKSSEFDPVRKSMSRKMKVLRKTISESLDGPNKDELRRHL